MKKAIFYIIFLFIIGVGIYGGKMLMEEWKSKDTPDTPPINIDIPTVSEEPEKPDCSDISSMDEKMSCMIENYSDTDNVLHYSPEKQTIINGTRDKNNQILWNHISKTAHNFFIAGERSYLIVKTRRNIAPNRDFLLGVLGRSQGVIHKNNSYNFISDISENKRDNLYIFSVTKIEIGTDNRSINLLDYRNAQNTVPISFAIGEAGNYVTDIYLINLPKE